MCSQSRCLPLSVYLGNSLCISRYVQPKQVLAKLTLVRTGIFLLLFHMLRFLLLFHMHC